MKKTKKFLASLFLLALSFVLCFAVACGGSNGGKSENDKQNEFIADIGGVSETYQGSVSEEVYAEPAQAATAYVLEQVVGEKPAQIVNTESKGELSSTEITALNLPAEVSNGVIGVEKIEVEYSETIVPATVSQDGFVGATVLYDNANTTKKVTVYIIKYETGYKYFTPLPETGSTISKSYYDSVFNSAKYKNCTFETEMTMSMDYEMNMAGEVESSSSDVSVYQLLKFTEDKIYMETRSTSKYDGVTSSDEMYMYIELVDSELKVYVKYSYSQGSYSDSTNGQWVEGSLEMIGFESIDELKPFAEQYLDYTFFTKTDYGFEIGQENFIEFLKYTIRDAELDFDEMKDYMDLDMIAKYYVSDGVLSGMREDVEMSVEVSEMGVSMEMGLDIEAVATCTNYGTTVIENPITSGGNGGAGNSSTSGSTGGTSNSGAGVGGGGAIQPGTTTVTAQEWANALDFTSGAYSYSVNMVNQNTILDYKFDGSILYCKQTDEDGILEEYMYVNDGSYYELEKYNDGAWTVNPSTQDDYESEAYGILATYSQMFTFDSFTYNDADQRYEAASLAGGWLQNATLTFRNGKVMTATYQMEDPAGELGLVTQIIIFNYDEFTLTLPQVSEGDQGATNETTSGITSAEGGLVGKIEG